MPNVRCLWRHDMDSRELGWHCLCDSTVAMVTFLFSWLHSVPKLSLVVILHWWRLPYPGFLLVNLGVTFTTLHFGLFYEFNPVIHFLVSWHLWNLGVSSTIHLTTAFFLPATQHYADDTKFCCWFADFNGPLWTMAVTATECLWGTSHIQPAGSGRENGIHRGKASIVTINTITTTVISHYLVKRTELSYWTIILLKCIGHSQSE